MLSKSVRPKTPEALPGVLLQWFQMNWITGKLDLSHGQQVLSFHGFDEVNTIGFRGLIKLGVGVMVVVGGGGC